MGELVHCMWTLLRGGRKICGAQFFENSSCSGERKSMSIFEEREEGKTK